MRQTHKTRTRKKQKAGIIGNLTRTELTEEKTKGGGRGGGGEGGRNKSKQ